MPDKPAHANVASPTNLSRGKFFWFGLAVTVASAFLILLFYHDRFWFLRDDGYYAQIAARILAGDVIHRDVQALHTGLIYFANALALKLFGADLLSMRFPLILMGVLQAVLD